MDAEQASSQPCGVCPTATQQHGAASPTTDRPKSNVPATELRQLPAPTTHVGAESPRDEASHAIGQHCAKHGAKRATEYTNQ